MSGIDDKIELHLISTADLVEEARKIKEARDLAKQSKEVKKDLSAGVSPLGQANKSPIGAPVSNKPKGFFDSEQQSRKSAVGGARTDNAFKQQQQKQKDLERQIAEQAKKQDDLEKQNAKNLKDLQTEIKQKQKDLEDAQKEFETRLTGGFKSFSTITSGLASGNLLTGATAGILTKLGRFGIIGSLIAGAIATVISAGQAQFANGGVFSTFLKVPLQALTIENIESSNSFNNATRYITSDLRITQKAPQNSNSEKLSAESVRYVVNNLGRSG